MKFDIRGIKKFDIKGKIVKTEKARKIIARLWEKARQWKMIWWILQIYSKEWRMQKDEQLKEKRKNRKIMARVMV